MTSFVWSLLAALAWGCAPLLEKIGLAKIDPMVGLVYRCLGVVIGMVLLISFQWNTLKVSVSHIPKGFEYLVLGGFLASILGQTFFYHALKTGEASRVVPLAGAYPLISFILAVIILGEKVTLSKAAGLAFVLLGVLLLK